jgi:hypothetical protein
MIDAITLAKMPFVDAERLNEVFLAPAKIYAIQRLARQRRRLESDMAARKTRIISILDGYLPGVRLTFSNLWSFQAKAFLKLKGFRFLLRWLNKRSCADFASSHRQG